MNLELDLLPSLLLHLYRCLSVLLYVLFVDDGGFRYIVQLSVKCSDPIEAEETLQIVRDSLFHENDCESDTESEKPKLLWSVFLIQDIPNPSQVTWWILPVIDQTSVIFQNYVIQSPLQCRQYVVISDVMMNIFAWTGHERIEHVRHAGRNY